MKGFIETITRIGLLTADLQVNEVNIGDRESVKAFHNNVYLVYLPVCSVHLSHIASSLAGPLPSL